MDGDLQEQTITCPYCWESITVLLDPGDSGGSYIEDCQVCCRPILFRLHTASDGALMVDVSSEDD
jgi:hypothetical protein